MKRDDKKFLFWKYHNDGLKNKDISRRLNNLNCYLKVPTLKVKKDLDQDFKESFRKIKGS